MDHAFLSPSGAKRWLTCTRSARFGKEVMAELGIKDTGSRFAFEGTLAHSLGELYIRKFLNIVNKFQFKNILLKIKNTEYRETPESEPEFFYNKEMDDYAKDYSEYVIARYMEAKAIDPSAYISVEERVYLDPYVPESFGTRDVCIVYNGRIVVIDLKYGQGIWVDAEDNPQLKLYSLGTILAMSIFYNIETVELHIYQPRMDNIASWETKAADVLDWAENYVKPRARMAFDGTGTFVPGEHCNFCPAEGVCKALADYNLQLAMHDFATPTKLTDEEIVDILTREKIFTGWLAAVKEHALFMAAVHGKQWPMMKMVEGRSIRQYPEDYTEILKRVLDVNDALEEDQLIEKNLIGITKMEKLIGKKTFATLVDPLMIKPTGKPVLVPKSDKRVELGSIDQAKLDFSQPYLD